MYRGFLSNIATKFQRMGTKRLYWEVNRREIYLFHNFENKEKERTRYTCARGFPREDFLNPREA